MTGLNNIKRLLRVALIGAPNSGKSTLLNRLVGSDISSVSKRVHTTRSNELGVITKDDIQLVFLDSPGLITRKHLLKFRLEDSLYYEPQEACKNCDLIAVLVDASNIREQKRLNRGVIDLLRKHQECKSFLIMNKIDLVKEKRLLLDIGTRLTQGFLDGSPAIKRHEILRMPLDSIRDLNLSAHLSPTTVRAPIAIETTKNPLKKNYVIDMNDSPKANDASVNDDMNNINHPDRIGFKSFSRVFSISALKDDGVVALLDALFEEAKPVESWPHGPDYLTNKDKHKVVISIIRGRIMDLLDRELPYMVELELDRMDTDDYGSLHIDATINCSKNSMIPRVLGSHGSTIYRIVEESRKLISKNFGCDVKLNVEVKVIGKTRRVSSR